LKEKKFHIPGREEEEKQQQQQQQQQQKKKKKKKQKQKNKEEILIDSLLGRGTQVTTRKESWHGAATLSPSAVATVAGTTLDQCAKDLQSTGPPRVLQLSRTLRGRGRGECRQQ
jgi:hypothetical protein